MIWQAATVFLRIATRAHCNPETCTQCAHLTGKGTKSPVIRKHVGKPHRSPAIRFYLLLEGFSKRFMMSLRTDCRSANSAAW